MKLKIVNMYPDILNMYGDIGNLKSINQRAKWRGIETEIINFTTDSDENSLDDDVDIILVGGGSDHGQTIVSNHLVKQRNVLENYIEEDKFILAICGSYQMFGNVYIDKDDNSIPCLELFDIETKSGPTRMIGDILIESTLKLEPNTIIGFENHGGETFHNYQALGTVKIGYGNNRQDNLEGMIYKNFIGTYLHGSLLPKNPQLADYIILKALQKKYDIDKLIQLNDIVEFKAHENMKKRLIE